MDQNASRALIQAGQAVLGIEFGSTRIKAVLVDGQGHTLAVGTHDWENRLENGIWTYSLEDIHEGLQGCYASLKAQVQAQYGITLQKLAAAGISAMMHGYLAFDREGRPMLQVFSTCRHFIRTIPALVYDQRDVEDVESKVSEDHIYDECRYVLMENPISPRKNEAAKPPAEDPLDLAPKRDPYQFYRM